jgi:DNA primase
VEPTAGDVKSRVLESTDIVELIGRTVRLQRRGKDHVGLCPFHQEKTPSFTVSPAKQLFHCFGCKKSGNVIDFVIERDRVEFKDALRTLAEAAGIPMSQGGSDSANKTSEIQALRDANAAACMFFEKQLAHPAIGKAAREYLGVRGFDAESIKRFRIGLAPAAWDAFQTSPEARKFSPAILALAGLLKPRQQGEGHYDTFRNRLMFPIRDAEGRIIAFGGRVMPGSDDAEGNASAPAKYLNSPQTPLFDKGRCAFGLDLARQRIIETRTVAVVEGYTDVVMAHQFGCTNVVSTLGTALTDRHLTLLGRFADRVVLLFDPDAAGDAAVDRAIELAMTHDKLELAVVTLPDGLDPDEFLLRHGAAEFEKVCAQAADAVGFKWKQLTARLDLRPGDLLGRQTAVRDFMAFLSAMAQRTGRQPKGWDSTLARAARLTDFSIAQLQQMAGREATHRPARRAQVAAGKLPKTEVLTARDHAESFILGYLLCEPGRWASAQQKIAPDDFSPGPRRKLAEIYWRHQQDEGEPVLNEFVSLLDGDPAVKTLAVEAAQEVSRLAEPDKVLDAHLRYLDGERARLKLGTHQALLRSGTAADEVAELEKISALARVPDPRRLAVPYGV